MPTEPKQTSHGFDRFAGRQSAFSLRFFALTLGVFVAAGLLGAGLIQLRGTWGSASLPIFPLPFWISTVLLAGVSTALHRGVSAVQREQQWTFRRYLIVALAAGTGFVGVQAGGLWQLVETRAPGPAETGIDPFLIVLVALHGMHIVVALLFLVFVTLKSLTNRYDHEYYWGVLVCEYFWHLLGAVWLVIIAVFTAACAVGSL